MVLVLIAVAAPGVSAVQEIKVGGYQFEPFLDGKKGVTVDLIALLNKIQPDYHFSLVRIPAQRRYQLMRAGAIDMLMFEMPTWGWADSGVKVETTAPLLSAHEVFVVRAGTWNYDLPAAERLKRRMALTLGYHYAFAGFNADQKFLKDNFDVVFAETQTRVLKYLVAGTADVAILSDMFLALAEKRDPTLSGVLQVVPPHDQDYHLPILVRSGAKVSAEKMSVMLEALKKSGDLKRFFDHQGLGKFLSY